LTLRGGPGRQRQCHQQRETESLASARKPSAKKPPARQHSASC
jgi:hypothetical protein